MVSVYVILQVSKSKRELLGLNGLFGKSCLYLNNVPVSQSTHHHNLKAAFHKLVGTDRMEKIAPAGTEAYWYEMGDSMDSASSPGFSVRRKLFTDSSGNLTQKARLCGYVYHPLIENDAGNITNFYDLCIIIVSIN